MTKEVEAPHKFPWGRVIEDHEIGPYTIREYHPRKETEHGQMLREIDTDKAMFHGYVDGTDVCQSWASLDAALAGVITYRAQGPNAQSAEYFMKMISA
ncbi:hypothetical protein [Salipiger mucosus]|uniref:Uncharacterized protein n=1 Tax=Salipiger mucosus DSM 16094 TaxID=1123237 RepID=S9S0V8_9RHOB|nr:hypothetical protein [Salipiger mucosus]EPX83875.1 hypothetical protein Salmuc_01650 [Salipiger mucosus DSM 16094]